MPLDQNFYFSNDSCRSPLFHELLCGPHKLLNNVGSWLSYVFLLEIISPNSSSAIVVHLMSPNVSNLRRVYASVVFVCYALVFCCLTSSRVFPLEYFHSIHPLALRAKTMPAAVLGELNRWSVWKIKTPFSSFRISFSRSSFRVLAKYWWAVLVSVKLQVEPLRITIPSSVHSPSALACFPLQ